MKILGREPALYLALLYAVITVVGTGGLLHFTGIQAGLLNAAIAAVVGAITAYATKPIAPAAFTYAIAALVALGSTYGLVIPDAMLAGINGLVIPALMLISRGQVSPVDTAITKPSLDPTPEAAKADLVRAGGARPS